MAIPWDLIVIQTVNGIVTGMILALVASGLTLIFGIMDVVNFAHGDLYMLGAYVGTTVLATTGSFWLALEHDAALARRDEAHDGLERRALADAVAAEQSHHLAGPHRQRHAVQDVALAIEGV